MSVIRGLILGDSYSGFYGILFQRGGVELLSKVFTLVKSTIFYTSVASDIDNVPTILFSQMNHM